MSTVEVELDEELLARVDEQVGVTGRERSEVIAEALRRQFGASRMREVLAEVRQRSGLSEQEAMDLAVSELAAVRAERAAGETA